MSNMLYSGVSECVYVNKMLLLLNFQVSLPEAERKYKQAMKMNAQLEKEKSKLMSRVDTLQQLGHLLCETRTECIEAKRVKILKHFL